MHNGYTVKLIPVTYHVLQDDDGSNGISTEQIESTMERVNQHYKEAGIEFFQCGATQYHLSTALNDFDKGTDDAGIDGFHVSGTVNIYFANAVTSTSGGICGYAYFPSNKHYTVMKNSCAYNGTTFEHELGHYFNLYHTHQTFGGVLESVARPTEGKPYNCDTQGDRLCGTEADPSLSGVSLTNCIPSGLGTGPNGDPYRSDARNIMSYAGTKSCRTLFSEDQLALMNNTANNNFYRSNYTCPDAPKADFSSNKTTDCIQSTISFYDEHTGSGTASYLWTFEGGTPTTSTDENPTVSYATSGKFDVTLAVTTPNGTHTVTKQDYVHITYPLTLPYQENFSTGTSFPDEIATEQNAAASTFVSATAGKTDNGLALTGGGSIYYTTAEAAQSFISNPHYTSKLKLSCINATQYSSLSLTFDYLPLFDTKAEYTAIRFLVNGTQVGSIVQPSDQSAETWTVYQLDLTPYVGGYIDFAVEVNAKGSANGIYIDNINIDGSLNKSSNPDAGVLDVISPNAGADYCGSNIIPTVAIKNFSNTVLTSVDLGYAIDGILYPTINKTGLSVASEDTLQIQLPAIGTLGFGSHTFKVYTSAPNGSSDHYALNDTALTTFSVGGGVLGKEDFENESNSATGNNCTVEVSLNGNWQNLSGDDTDWRVDNGGTGSTGTGPAVDHTTGSATGKYIYTEASSCLNSTAELQSKCMDLSKYENASISFWYHMYGANMGSLSLDVIEGSTTHANVFTISGDQGDVWLNQTVDLSAYKSGEVQLKFKGTTGGQYTSDISLDDIEITGTLKVDTSVTLVGDLVMCQGNQSTLVAVSNSSYTYQWTKNGVDIPTGTSSSLTVTETGDYAVKVTLGGTTKTSSTRSFTVDICTGLSDLKKGEFTVFPNPAKNLIFLNYPDGSVSRIALINQQGKVVMKSHERINQMNVAGLAPGLYLIQVLVDGKSLTKSIIINP